MQHYADYENRATFDKYEDAMTAGALAEDSGVLIFAEVVENDDGSYSVRAYGRDRYL